MYISLHAKYPLFSSHFNETLVFLDRFSKNSHISNFLKIRPVGAELFHADGQTDGRTEKRTEKTQLIVAFRNFANTLNNFQSNTNI
jgi:hypothetical protein